jgi:single-strand DNA-binding protein
MSGSLNKVIIIGNLGRDPEIRSTQSGDKVATLNVATSENWKDKDGNRQEKSEWHRIVIFGKVADVCERYLKKGSKVLIEGKLQTRKWTDNNGQDKYSTEIVVSGFGGNMTMLDGKDNKQDASYSSTEYSDASNGSGNFGADLDDSIPF